MYQNIFEDILGIVFIVLAAGIFGYLTVCVINAIAETKDTVKEMNKKVDEIIKNLNKK